jgi:hypothetical protein
VEDSIDFDSENSLDSVSNFDSYCSLDKSSLDYILPRYSPDNMSGYRHFTACNFVLHMIDPD